MKKPKATPKALLPMFEHQQDMMRHVDEMLYVKTLPLENQASWARDTTPDYWLGLAYGVNNMLETLLHRNGCYGGFHYQRKNETTLADGFKFRETCGPNHPEYAEWRRRYII